MRFKASFISVVAAAACALAPAVAAQQATVGLLVHGPEVSPGYTLVSPLRSREVVLIDHHAHPVHRWTMNHTPGLMAYLLPNGNLLRAAAVTPIPANFRTAIGGGGRLEEWDWDGNLVWEMDIINDLEYQHHDFKKISNGNILAIIWVFKTRDEAIQAGRNPAATAAGGFWPDAIYEIEPTPPVGGNIVWEWQAWDHYVQDFDPSKDNYGVVSEHPELLDINTPTDDGQQDNNHLNGLEYHEGLQQILLSSRAFNEFWIIDHSTTTAEAAGHSGGRSGMGGDILYRWGNPQKYGRGTPDDRQLFNQHDAQWVPAGHPGEGNIIVFNNGFRRQDFSNWSSVEEIVPPLNADGTYDIAPGEAFGPATPVWSYPPAQDPDFLSPIIAGTQRLPNGNTLICEGTTGTIFEVTPDMRTVWEYVSPILDVGVATQGQNLSVMPPIPLQTNAVFKVRRYPLDYPGLAGRDLTPDEVLEIFDPPPPVPDGRDGTNPMLLAKSDPSASQIALTWDAASCTASNYNLYYGMLSDVASYVFQGSSCMRGTGGSVSLGGLPAGNVFMLMAGVGEYDIYESSLGFDSFGRHRNGYVPSLKCTITTRSLVLGCP